MHNTECVIIFLLFRYTFYILSLPPFYFLYYLCIAMGESNIVTGQYVRISQTAASVGERMLARLIDIIIVTCYFIGITLLMAEINITWTQTQVFFAIAVYLPALFYSFLFEVLNNGQTIGKMAMKIRVVNKDGSRPTLGAYFMRWLLWIIDGSMGIGIIVILLSKNNQRIGDLAAGTMVIRLQSYKKIHVSLDEFGHLSANYKPIYAQVSDLSLNQIDVIQRCLNSEYSRERSMRINTLYHKVHDMLGIPYDKRAPEQFLYTVVRDYQHFALEEV